IALVKTKEINGGMRMFMGTETEDEGSESYDYSYPFHMKINHISYVMPYQIPNASFKTVFGAGYRTYYDYGYNYLDENDPDYKEETNSHGGFNTLTFGGAVNFNDKFYAGATFNLGIMGGCESVSKYGDEDEEKDKADVSGSFLLLGGRFSPNPKLALGLMYRPGFTYTIKEKYEGGTDKTKIDIPGIIGLSGQYLITDNLLLVAEYQNRAYEDFEESNQSYYDELDNGSALRFGGEYLGSIPVRFGMFMDSQPVTDEDDTAPKSMLGFTGGVGFPMGDVMEIDIYGQYGMLKREGTDWEDSFHSIKLGAAVKYEL
ncbi:hypothetical protein DRP43_04380, partial [candidate division TA06 bacterium]